MLHNSVASLKERNLLQNSARPILGQCLPG